jgi:hypothetical protein
MIGPFPVIGDCVLESDQRAMAFIEFESLCDGDLGIWFMPSREPEEQYASKWLVMSDGWWLACKYFAVRYRPGFHIPIGRVTAIVSGGPGSFEPDLSARMAQEIRELRTAPPSRADLVVFPNDILDRAAIVAAIDQHRRRWAS